LRLCDDAGVTDASPPAARERADDARRAGRGGIFIGAAKIYFILLGLVQQIALKHLLGGAAYGDLGQVLSAASIVYNPIVQVGIQGVSRAVSGSPSAEQAAAQRRALTLQCLAVLPLSLAFFLGAGWLANAGAAPHLADAARIAAIVLLAYGLYAPLVGALNGNKRFGLQAGLDATAATLRTVGLLGGAWLYAKSGRGVEGSLGGFAAAATLMVVLAAPLAGLGRREPGGPSVRDHLLFLAPLFGGQFLLNMLMQADLQLLSRFAGRAADAAGLEVEAAGAVKGAYRAAQLFGFLPYQLLFAIAFVLFPVLASAQRDGDRQAVAQGVRSGMRVAMVLAGLMVSVTSGLSGPLLDLVFGADFAILGRRALSIMAVGLGAFAQFGILITVLNSLKRERMSALLTAVAFSLVVVLCFTLVRGEPYGEELLVRTALATGAGLLLATLLAALAVKRTTGTVLSPVTLLRVLAATALAIAVGRFLPAPGKLLTLGYAAAVALVYLAALVASRELTRADLVLLRRVAGR
jgi:stage V sporulation protein B